jgi:hypothetical protein
MDRRAARDRCGVNITSISLIDERSKRVIAFHEKAGPRQVDFDLRFLKSTFLPSGGFAERPGAVKGAFCAAGANP